MLIGEYTSQITSGNRTALPKKLRSELGNSILLTRGYEKSLLILSTLAWRELISSTARGPFTSQAVRDTARFLLGGAHEVSLDGQGRFVVPPALVEYAQLHNEVIFLGLERWVELWDKQQWREREKYLVKHSAVIGEVLTKLQGDNEQPEF